MTMTKREAYNAVIENRVTDEVVENFKELVASLDKANANRKTKKNLEQAETDKVVIAYLSADYLLASEIMKKINADRDADLFSTSKVVASCKRLEAEGKVKVTESRNGSRIVKAYALAD